jgi:hypothetical protein
VSGPGRCHRPVLPGGVGPNDGIREDNDERFRSPKTRLSEEAITFKLQRPN